MKKKDKKTLKLIGVIAICFAFIGTLIIYPIVKFHSNENMLESAARRYFDLYSNELPTGERVKTLSLQTLYHKAFLDEDLLIPLSKKTCSLSDSWVKVKRDDNDYKYYVYLKCGLMSSNVDHRGPKIKLNGDSDITIGVGEKYVDEGIKSVVDNRDGRIKIDDVLTSGKVDTNKVGTYEIKYSASDRLNNVTTEVRTITVVQKLNSTVKNALEDKVYYPGNSENNYMRISNQLFRIVSLDGKNVRIVSDEDVANVNYSKLDKWLDYYYENLNEFTKDAIVSTKYCNETLSSSNLNTQKCSKYTRKKKVYIPSVMDVNIVGGGYLKPITISWVANSASKEKAYVTRNLFLGEEYGKSFLTYSVDDNYGVRPMMTLNGEILITGGDGTYNSPYVFGDVEVGKGGDLVNTRQTGEYVKVSGKLWRIIKTNSDGTTKVIMNDTLGTLENDITCFPVSKNGSIEYNPKDKSSVGYYINNEVSNYIKTSYFVNHEIEVPVYKNKIIYGEEQKTKKYKVVFSSPDMYEIFSAQSTNLEDHSSSGYWLINSSNSKWITGAISDAGSPYNVKLMNSESNGIRPVAFIKRGAVIVSGNGTASKPYVVK